MISFEQVTKRYGQRLALDSLSWRMDEGECVVFLGHSGAGKTTLLRLITHEIQPTSGTVTVGTFRGGRLSRPQRALLRRTLGIIYEDFRLLGDRTVFENVALAVRITGRFEESDVIPRVLYALDEVGLKSMQTAYPSELSAGEKQRAAIARAIVNRPAVLLADEPTGALERRSADEVLALLRRIHGEGAALLMVTTRQEVADAMNGRVLRIEEGRRPDGEGLAPEATSAPAFDAAQAPPPALDVAPAPALDAAPADSALDAAPAPVPAADSAPAPEAS
jgi:cell division transport system ATP-binding protein